MRKKKGQSRGHDRGCVLSDFGAKQLFKCDFSMKVTR
jgi:hypothetical protein